MSAHLVIAPILIPLAAAVLLLLVSGRRRVEAGVSIAAVLALLITAVVLLARADEGAATGQAYRIGDWPAPFAIVLVADRLSALMVLLSAVLGLVNVVFSLARWQRLGPYYQTLSQFLLMGLNGAFLTGDLFNLFVFFEILLAASYGLLLHGSGEKRVVAGLHYVVINLVASLLFLIGVSTIFGVIGSLNLAILAEQAPALPERSRALFNAGTAVLAVAFLVKTAAWPLGFWLPGAYDAAVPPAAAMFAVMTKMGVYALLRFGTLVAPGEPPVWLLVAGAATMIVGFVGLLAARDLGRLAGYNLLVSAGTLLGALGIGHPAVLAGALFYLVISTLAAAALFLMAGLISADGSDEFEEEPVLEDYDPAGDGVYTEEDERAVVISGAVGWLSAAFLLCTLLVAGMPPLAGFVAKLAMLGPMIADPGAARGGAGVLAALVIASSFVALLALMRAGVHIWWVEPGRLSPTLRLTEVAPLALLIGLCLVLTILPEAPYRFFERTAAQLHDPGRYVAGVLRPEGVR